MQNCNHSTVTRSETWVHTTVKSLLEFVRLKRKAKLQEHIDFIKKDRLKPQFRNFWNLFGKTKDTDDMKVLRAYSDDKYLWAWGDAAHYYYEDETRLMKILAATDPDLPFDHMMQLSVEDSALIEKWSNRLQEVETKENRIKNEDET